MLNLKHIVTVLALSLGGCAHQQKPFIDPRIDVRRPPEYELPFPAAPESKIGPIEDYIILFQEEFDRRMHQAMYSPGYEYKYQTMREFARAYEAMLDDPARRDELRKFFELHPNADEDILDDISSIARNAAKKALRQWWESTEVKEAIGNPVEVSFEKKFKIPAKGSISFSFSGGEVKIKPRFKIKYYTVSYEWPKDEFQHRIGVPYGHWYFRAEAEHTREEFIGANASIFYNLGNGMGIGANYNYQHENKDHSGSLNFGWQF